MGLPPTTATYLQEASLASGRPVASTDAVSTPTPQTGHTQLATAERPVGIYHRLPRATGGDEAAINSGPDQRHQGPTAEETSEHEAAIVMHTESLPSSSPQTVPTPMQHPQHLADVGALPRRRIRGKTTTTNAPLISDTVQQPQTQETARTSCQRNITEEHWIRQVATVKTNIAMTCNSCRQLTRVRCRSCTRALCIDCVKSRRPCNTSQVSGTASGLSSAPT